MLRSISSWTPSANGHRRDAENAEFGLNLLCVSAVTNRLNPDNFCIAKTGCLAKRKTLSCLPVWTRSQNAPKNPK